MRRDVVSVFPAPTAYPLRVFKREWAARYVGVSPTKFDELVRDGRMPKPFRVDGRVLWDLRKLDLAIDELSGESGRGEANSWD